MQQLIAGLQRPTMTFARRVHAWLRRSLLGLPAPRRRGLVEPALISAQAQWQRVSEVVSTGVSHAEAASNLHASARLQVDSASYAYDRIFQELSLIMPLQRQSVPAAVESRHGPVERPRQRGSALAA